MNKIWVLIGALVGILVIGLGITFGLGWLLSMLINPILLNFGLNTITPFIGFLIVLVINILIALIRR